MSSLASPLHPASAALRYDRVAIALHWIMAVLIVVVGVLGLLHDSWPRRSQAFWINLHALIGLSVWSLIVVRLGWRLRHPPPVPPPGTGVLTYAVHLLLYLLVFVIPLVGIVTFIWHGRAFDFGLFKVDFGVRANRAIFTSHRGHPRLPGIPSLRPDRPAHARCVVAPVRATRPAHAAHVAGGRRCALMLRSGRD